MGSDLQDSWRFLPPTNQRSDRTDRQNVTVTPLTCAAFMKPPSSCGSRLLTFSQSLRLEGQMSCIQLGTSHHPTNQCEPDTTHSSSPSFFLKRAQGDRFWDMLRKRQTETAPLSRSESLSEPTGELRTLKESSTKETGQPNFSGGVHLAKARRAAAPSFLGPRYLLKKGESLGVGMCIIPPENDGFGKNNIQQTEGLVTSDSP